MSLTKTQCRIHNHDQFAELSWAGEDEQFAGAEARDGDGFEAEVIDAAIDDGAHGLGG
jgi:hypothetical protein